jgi:hypothetical protein
MLSKYDEYPVHQSAHPFSRIPSTDMSWDEGYYFGIFNADEQVFLLTGLRVNPNADIVGGYAVIKSISPGDNTRCGYRVARGSRLIR